MSQPSLRRGLTSLIGFVGLLLLLLAAVQRLGIAVTPVPTDLPTDAPPSTPAVGGPERPTPSAERYRVVEVVDGDTVRIERAGRRETVRLIGIDTPETSDPRRPVQCFGREATERAEALLDGTLVRVAVDPTQDEYDRYGRWLLYLWPADGDGAGGVTVNERLVAEGFAHEYTYDAPYLLRDRFRAAERAAKAAGRGFWSPDTCGGDTDRPAERVGQPVDPTAPSSGCDLTRRCGDFATWDAMYAWWTACGRPAGYDGDGDDVPCEALRDSR